MYIPRLIANNPRNDVYNSGRHLIAKEIDLENSAVQLYHPGPSYAFRERLGSNVYVDVEGEIVSINVTHSLLSSIPISMMFYIHLVPATNLKTKITALAFA
jgi:hypothetical protein